MLFTSKRAAKNYAEKIWDLKKSPPDPAALEQVRKEYSEHDRCRVISYTDNDWKIFFTNEKTSNFVLTEAAPINDRGDGGKCKRSVFSHVKEIFQSLSV